MIDLNEIADTIKKIENGDTTWDACERLSILYNVRNGMTGTMSRRSDSGYSIAGPDSSQLSREEAERWVQSMKNADGTTGPHWSIEKTKQVQAQREIGGSPLYFWVAINYAYSDFCNVAKKLGVNTVDFYASIAEAFLDDQDAVGGGGGEKLAAYYDAVVKH